MGCLRGDLSLNSFTSHLNAAACNKKYIRSEDGRSVPEIEIKANEVIVAGSHNSRVDNTTVGH
jgi:tRNA pseudouridine-54 N-methylase